MLAHWSRSLLAGCGGLALRIAVRGQDFEQRAADISVNHPRVVENYREGHTAAVKHSQGRASTEDLRRAMIHYRSLFEELIGQPEWAAERTRT